MIIIENIETSLWNQIINDLVSDGWVISSQYDNFDKGIDFNSKTLRKGKVKIDFEWDNWEEGVIKCKESEIEYIEKLVGINFPNKRKKNNLISKIISSNKK